MSYTRIYEGLEHLTCRVTHRGKEVLKSGGMGFMAGAISGVTLGGLAVGFTDVGFLETGKSNFKAAHTAEFPEKCETYKTKDRAGHEVENTRCTRPGLDDAAGDYGLAYAKAEIAKVGPWIAVGCTLGGALLGLLIGAKKGWNEPLPAYLHEEDLEAQRSNVNFARLG